MRKVAHLMEVSEVGAGDAIFKRRAVRNLGKFRLRSVPKLAFDSVCNRRRLALAVVS